MLPLPRPLRESFFPHLNLLVMYLGNGKIWEHLPMLGSAHSSCRTGPALAFSSCMHLYGFFHAFQPRDKRLLVVPCTPPFQRNCGQPRQAVVCCSISNLWKKPGHNGLLCWKAQVSGEWSLLRSFYFTPALRRHHCCPPAGFSGWDLVDGRGCLEQLGASSRAALEVWRHCIDIATP